MKYGETLRQRSIPAWSAYNIDYDDVKHFIKEHTTPGKGKSVAVPGRGDDKLQDFENDLFLILKEQHHRIDLFVKSKAREIQHRLDDANKRLRILANRSAAADGRIPVRRLERYSKLESDVLKAGDEIKSLARFTGTQRTAFRKLLKKYKKWTGSTQLEDRFREQVLDEAKSFTRFDLGPLLDHYSETLHDIRALYESRLRQSTPGAGRKSQAVSDDSSTIVRLHEAILGGSRVELDTAITTVPLGDSASYVRYFVHPENIVELQVLLLQHLRYFMTRSRSNSIVAPIPMTPKAEEPGTSQQPDYFSLAADAPHRFVQEQSSLTVNDRENASGYIPQRVKVCARWNAEDEAIITTRTKEGQVRTVNVKRKHVASFFDKQTPFLIRRGSSSLVEVANDLQAARNVLEQDESVQPIYQMSCCRSRFVGLNSTSEGVLLATLDTGIRFQSPDSSQTQDDSKIHFPFAVLAIRQEGQTASNLFDLLNHSHLVERVPGFSLEHHAAWQVCRPDNIPAPFWVTMLEDDIRKLPPPAIKPSSSSTAMSPTARHGSTSAGSLVATTDSVTAVETTRRSSLAASGLETPSLRSFRKKRRRAYPEGGSLPHPKHHPRQQQQQQRYWSEYDHPEDGSENGDAYVIYIDPNEKSPFDRFVDSISNLFSRHRQSPADDSSTLLPPRTPNDEESSSDESSPRTPLRQKLPRNNTKSYGTLPLQQPNIAASSPSSTSSSTGIPHLTALCMTAAIALIILASILSTTGKHRYIREVDAGVIFAVSTSLFFACAGVASLWRVREVRWWSWAVAVVLLVGDAVVAGELIAGVVA